MPRQYVDRRDGGRALAEHLLSMDLGSDVVVLALPRGGVPVGDEVARRLGAPLDVLVVRKLGLPQQPELAMGAIASGGVRVLNEEVLALARVDPRVIEEVAAREERELRRREVAYRGHRAAAEVEGRTVLLVDDGLATGSTMRAAVASLRQRGPARVVAAVPVAARETCDEFRNEGIELACPLSPSSFHAVGAWYADFPQTSDDEVREILEAAAARRPGSEEAGG